MRVLFDGAYLLAAVFYLPVLAYQMIRQGKNRRGWRQRFGGVPCFAPGRRRIWLHAVSLGEINATPLLVKQLGERLPDHEIVISTTTDTGYARACQLYGAERVFRYPLDFSLVAARALRRVRPTMIVLVELEVWPNLVGLARRREIPVVVVNGRLTARSRRRFGLIAPLVRGTFADLAWVGAQDEAIAARFVELGAAPDRVHVTGSLKWDSAVVADSVDGADELAAQLGVDRSRPLWVCGSTGPGEEAILLDAYRELRDPRIQLAIVPRKPERFDEVAELIRRRGYECVRRSARVQGSRHPPRRVNSGQAGFRVQTSGLRNQDSVILGDTMGELRKFYSLARVVFVGRSLVPMGGSDPMEVAALGKPILTGPHMDNFRHPVEVLSAAGALRTVPSASELAAAVREWCSDSVHALGLGQRARGVVLDQQGATERCIAALVAIAGH